LRIWCFIRCLGIKEKEGNPLVKRISEGELAAIEAVIGSHPEGMGVQEIADRLKAKVPRRTLQYRLKHLVDKKRLVKTGDKRGALYKIPQGATLMETGGSEDISKSLIPISKGGVKVQNYLRTPFQTRKPVGYHRNFLDSYRPNRSAYLSEKECSRLHSLGKSSIEEQPAGTYARQILNRLLIDLSWNSSRLEGNTYSLLDTKRLIDFGQEASGKELKETQMILNHKDAIEFLVQASEEINFNRYTLLNLHAMLANNLLEDPHAAGRLRQIAVGIEKSAFHPLEVPQIIEECFDQLLATAKAIKNPFEQAFFILVHIPYLQPFDDVNKRVSRLAANIPLIKKNLIPLSFIDVPTKTYTEAILGIYELNDINLLKNIFTWAYERSVFRYTAVRQSLGEPDPFRLKYRKKLESIIREIILKNMDRITAINHINMWAIENIDFKDRSKFQQLIEEELLSLHEGNFARYQVRPSEFQTWQEVWKSKPSKKNFPEGK